MAAEQADVSEDAVLGGRLILRQPRKGHRVGHDAILLAAACSARPRHRLIELGAGVGAAGLAVARRVDDLAATLVEIDPALVALARENAARNGLEGRVHAVCLDVAAPADAFAAAGLPEGAADHVLMNPPFNAAHNPSPDRGRRLAHAATDDTILALGRCRRATPSSRGRRHADLAGGWTGCGAGSSCRRFRRGYGLTCSSQTGCCGDPRAGTRRQSKPRAACAIAGFVSCRPSGTPDGRSGGRVARRRAASVSRGLNRQQVLRFQTRAAIDSGATGARCLGRASDGKLGKTNDDADQHQQHVYFHRTPTRSATDVASK